MGPNTRGLDLELSCITGVESVLGIATKESEGSSPACLALPVPGEKETLGTYTAPLSIHGARYLLQPYVRSNLV